MKSHTHETEDGVLIRVEYEPDGDTIEFVNARLLDVDYRPVGPNLCEFLHSLVRMTSADTAERYLQQITEEILNEPQRAR